MPFSFPRINIIKSWFPLKLLNWKAQFEIDEIFVFVQSYVISFYQSIHVSDRIRLGTHALAIFYYQIGNTSSFIHYQRNMIIVFLNLFNKRSFYSWTFNQFKDKAKGTRKTVFRDKERMGLRHLEKS